VYLDASHGVASSFVGFSRKAQSKWTNLFGFLFYASAGCYHPLIYWIQTNQTLSQISQEEKKEIIKFF